MAIHHNLDPHTPKAVTKGHYQINKALDRYFISAPGETQPERRIYIAEVMMAHNKDQQTANACMFAASKDLMTAMSRILVNCKSISPRDRQLAQNAMDRANGKIP